MQEDLSVRVMYLSHSCFEVQDVDHTLLIDPFFSKENPNAPTYAGKPDIVLVTHEHFDHSSAERFNATVVAPPTIAGRFKKMIVMERGESKLVEGVRVTMIGASHHQSKYPAGYVFELGGVRFAHLGDTYLDGVQPLENVDVLFIPIGGFFTMNVEEAVKALDILNPDEAIPMHYGTFSQIKEADPKRFKQLAEKAGHHVTVLSIGATATF
jgi:L-ascorbate metabolism protein UlaG (beta-lactamase superfamily)